MNGVVQHFLIAMLAVASASSALADGEIDHCSDLTPHATLGSVLMKRQATISGRQIISSTVCGAPGVLPHPVSLADLDSSVLSVRYPTQQSETADWENLPFHVRAGLLLTPNIRLAGGIDYMIIPAASHVGLRLDAEALVDANTRGRGTLFPVTFDVISVNNPQDSLGFLSANAYIGAGIGPYIAQRTRFGGKVFAGLELAGKLGAELGVHIPGDGDVLLSLELRLGL